MPLLWDLLGASCGLLGFLGSAGALLEGPWELLGALLGTSCDLLGSPLGSSLGALGRSLGTLGVLLGASCDLRGLSWELLLAAWASLGGSWGPLAGKMQNERVKSKPPRVEFGFDVFLIKSFKPKVNEMENSMSNYRR